MEENKLINETTNLEQESNEEESTFNFKTIIAMLILNWQWFVLSLLIRLMAAFVYLRYTHPVYEVTAKLLVKDQENNKSYRGNSMLSNMQDLGFMSNSVGIDNEVEILQSHIIAEQAVKDLKLYVNYKEEGRIKDQLQYKNNPFNIDLDSYHLDKLKNPIDFTISKDDGKYIVSGITYTENGNAAIPFESSFNMVPATISTRCGVITITKNPGYYMTTGRDLKISIVPPKSMAIKFVNSMTVEPTSKTTSIALITLHDVDPDRAIDYLNQLVICYNRQANIDKNEVAMKTEGFINARLEKINAELGNTESSLENYKKRNNVTELKLDATSPFAATTDYPSLLSYANTQIQLLDYLTEYVNAPSNKMQVIPSNVGLKDEASSNLINKYNEAVLERNRLLRSASESSPTVATYTNTINELSSSIRAALTQARRGMDIERQGIEKQYNMYAGKIQSTPEQERILTQIGRQQDVKSGLYIMLLQKREENSISLAATADKGKLIDTPQYMGKVSPKGSLVWLIALVLGFAIPFLIIYVIQLFKYKIEGHEDGVKLTKIPVLADIAIARNVGDNNASIVVHENQNSQMEEVFRALRTNLQFVMQKNENVIMFTSSTSGEGKTFTASNLSISFALLGKKVVLVGLDIRKPRLSQLFGIHDHGKGITTFLCDDNATKEDLLSQVFNSGVNKNLDILPAGPIPPNPAELLARPNLEKAIGILKEKYDYVILDTAPVGLVSDTLLIGRASNATIYICRADYTPKASFALINSLKDENKLPNINIVLNGIDMTKKKYGYYYGYGKYGKYSYHSKHVSYGSYGYGYGNYEKVYGQDEQDNSSKK